MNRLSNVVYCPINFFVTVSIHLLAFGFLKYNFYTSRQNSAVGQGEVIYRDQLIVDQLRYIGMIACILRPSK